MHALVLLPVRGNLFVAQCVCGYRTPVTTSRQLAEAQASQHLVDAADAEAMSAAGED